MNSKIQISNQHSKESLRSFTLIEILVTIAIFSLILGMISGLFSSALKAQRRSLASQELLRQTSYATEYMSRQLRMAKRSVDSDWLSSAGLNYEETDSGIKFINYKGEYCEFFVSGDPLALKFLKGEEAAVNLISDDFEVEEFNINIIEGENVQPRVTLFLKIKGRGEKSEDQPVIKIQTTISQRDINL